MFGSVRGNEKSAMSGNPSDLAGWEAMVRNHKIDPASITLSAMQYTSSASHLMRPEYLYLKVLWRYAKPAKIKSLLDDIVNAVAAVASVLVGQSDFVH